MASKIKGLTVVINGDTTKLTKALREAKSEATILRTHLASLGKLIEFNPASTELLTQKQRLLGQALAQNASALAMMRAAEEQYHAQIGPHSQAEIREYESLRRSIVQNQLQYENLKAQAISFGAAASSSTLTLRGHLQSANETLKKVSMQALAVGAASAYVGYLAIESAASFESAFAGVRKTINTTEEQYRKLSDAIREMALEKPVTQEDIAYIMELGGQLNIAKEHLTQFAGVIADLDVSTDLNLEDASLKLAQFANIANMSQGDFDRLGSVVADLGNNSATTESAIVNMAMRIVGAASNIGMSVPDVLALAASLSAVGIQAEMGGNAISTIMNRIDRDVALNNDSLSVWAATAGMSVDEFVAAWDDTDTVTDALLAVVNGMGTYVDEGNNLNVLLKEMDISYMRQVDTMQRLSRTGELVTGMVTRATTAWDENIALTREASQRYETAESKLQLMKNAINEAGIAIGEEILPCFKDLVIATTDGIKAFGDMDDGTKSLVITMGGIATVGGLGIKGLELLTGAGQKAVGMYASLKTALAVYRGEQAAAAAAAAADTAATAANTASTAANAAAKEAAVAASVEEASAQSFATVAKEAATIATGKLTAALAAQNVAMTASIAGMATLAVVGVAALAYAIGKASDGTQNYTTATRQSQAAVEDATAAYDEAVRAHGATSDEAVKAKAALEDEQAAFESSKETIGRFCDRMQDTIDAHDSLVVSMQDTMAEADSSAGAMLNLADSIAEAYGGMDAGAEKTALLDSLTSSLSSQIDGLSLSYDGATDSLNMSAEAMKGLVDAEADRIRAEAAMENYAATIAEQAQIEADLAEAEAELAAETQRNLEIWGDAPDAYLATSKAQQELEGSVSSLGMSLEECKRKQKEYLDIMLQVKSRSAALKYASEALAGGQMDAAEAAAYYSEKFGVAITETDVLDERQRQLAESTREATAEIEDMKNEIDELSIESDVFASVLADSGMSAQELAERMQAAGIEVSDLKDQMQDLADKTGNAFERIEQESDITLDEMLENLRYNTEVTENWKDNIAELYARAGSESERNFVSEIAKMGPEYASQVQMLVDDSSGMLTELADTWVTATRTGSEGALVVTGLWAEETVQDVNEGCDGMVSAIDSHAQPAADAMANLVEGVDYQARTEAGKMSGHGDSAGSNYASALRATEPFVSGAASVVAEASAGINAYGGSSYGWGYDLVSNFASGMSVAQSLATGAANIIAVSTKEILGHSIPKKGPLHNGGKGEVEWGEHLVQNLVQGMENEEDSFKSAVERIAGYGDSAFSNGWGADLSSAMAAERAAASAAVSIESRNAAAAQHVAEVSNYYSIGGLTVPPGTPEADAMEVLVDYAKRAGLAYQR